jgi:hypothetical protein
MLGRVSAAEDITAKKPNRANEMNRNMGESFYEVLPSVAKVSLWAIPVPETGQSLTAYP